MAGAFDPYHRWLSIPPREQPPHLYRLLGLEKFEADPSVIECAADRQMAHVRLYQNGPQGEDSQRLLNEIAAAKVTLLDPQRKAAYDRQLNAASASASATKLIVAKPLEPEKVATPAAAEAPLQAKIIDDLPPAKSRVRLYVSLATVVVTMVMMGVIVVAFRMNGHQDVVAEVEPETTKSLHETRAIVTPPVLPPAVDNSGTPQHINDRPTPNPNPPIVVPPLPSRNDPPTTPTESSTGSETETDDAEDSEEDTTPAAEVSTEEEPAGDESERVAQAETPAASEVEELADARLPPPSAETRRKKLEQIEGLFAISDARTPAAKRDLANTLLETAQETREDNTARFVLFNLARELASAAGDLETALAAVRELDAEYQIDADAVRIACFDGAAKAALPNPARQSVVEQGNEYIDDLLNRDKYLEAAKLIQTLQIVARPLRDRELINALTERRTRGSTLYKQFQKSAAAMSALEKDPDDAEANLAAGRFYAFAKGDWDRGLPLLAKGGDAKLQALAQQEMATPTEAAEQLKLADAWWATAQGGSGIEANRQLARARMWYEIAADKLSGLTKVQAQKRLESLKHVALDGGEPLGSEVASIDPDEESPFEEVPDDSDDSSPTTERPEREVPAEPPLELAADAKLPKGGVLRLGTRRLTHSGGVEQLFVPGDGQSVVTIGSGRIQKWSLRDGSSVASESLITEEGHAHIAFDGERYAIIANPLKNGLNTQDFRVVDLSSGKEFAKFTHKEWSDSCAISPGGQLVALGNINRTVTLIDPRSGEVLETIPNDEFPEQPRVSFSQSGSVLAIRSGTLTKFFNVVMRSQLGKAAASIRHEGFNTLVLTHDGQKAAMVQNGHTTIYSTQTGEALKLIKHPAEFSVLGPKFSPDGKYLAMWIFDYRVVVIDVAGGGMVREIPTGRAMIRELDFTPDSRKLAGSLSGGRVLMWDLASGKELTVDPARDMTDGAIAVAISPDGRNIASADRKGYVTLWSHATKWQAEPLPNDGQGRLDPSPTPDFLQFAGGGLRLVAGSCNRRGSVNIWDVVSRRPIAHLEGHGYPAVSVAVHETTGLIASTGRDSTLRFWNATGANVRTIERLSGCLDFSPDGKTIAVACRHDGDQSKFVHLYDVATGGLVRRFEGHTFETCDVSFSPDGRRLVTTARDKSMRIWDVATGECKNSITPESERPHVAYGALCVEYSPRGDMIASTASDGGVYLWTPEGEPLATLRGHEGQVQSLAWRSDGKQLVSGGADNSIMVWDIAKAVPKK